MSKEKEGKWITVNGRHVLLKEGESVADAIKNGKDKRQRSYLSQRKEAEEDTANHARSVNSQLKKWGISKAEAIQAYKESKFTTKAKAEENIRLMEAKDIREMVEAWRKDKK